MYKWSLALCGLQGFLCHKINQTKLNLRIFWVFQKASPFHWNLTKSTFSPISGQKESRTIEKKKSPCPKTRIEDKTNLTFPSIKWPSEVDMPLNKTQTLPSSLHSCNSCGISALSFVYLKTLVLPVWYLCNLHGLSKVKYITVDPI